ncbi:hypothetical protein, partial [Novosphingobium guangzhouense]|uniref:hypothetical protein n=1 Tax=Novosphingobium guangzhouense TaxID=1850347 RepID=UPI001B80C6E4
MELSIISMADHQIRAGDFCTSTSGEYSISIYTCSRFRHGNQRISTQKPGLTVNLRAFTSPSCRNQTVLRGVQL